MLMNMLMWIAFILVALAAVCWVLSQLVGLFGAWCLTKMPFRRSSVSFIDHDAIPEKERSQLVEARGFLLSEGFAYNCSLRVFPPPVEQPGLNELYLSVYHHAESDVYAIVGQNRALAHPYIGYLSCFLDGTHLQTVNRLRHFSPDFDNPCIFDDYLPDDAAAWPAHRKRLRDSGREPARDKDLVLQSICEEEEGLIDRLLGRGALKPFGEGRWRLTWSFAFRWHRAMVKGHKFSRFWNWKKWGILFLLVLATVLVIGWFFD